MAGREPPDWDRIVDRHAQRVFRVALRILGSVHDAEDVAQDVFAEAYQAHQSGPVQTWTGLLVRLATWRALDRLRRGRHDEPLREHEMTRVPEPFEEAMASELAARLREAVGALPDQQAAVFALYHYEQMSRDEIASHLGISPEAVSTSLYKARQRLLTELAVSNRGELQ